MTIRSVSLVFVAGLAATAVGYPFSNETLAESQPAAPVPPIYAAAGTPTLAELASQAPDGADIVARYKAAETVAAVQEANRAVEAQIGNASAVVARVAAFQAALITACDERVDFTPIKQIVTRTSVLAATVMSAREEVTKSLATMRKAVEGDRAASEQAKDAVDQYIIADHRLGQLAMQADELAKNARGLAVSITRTAAQNCHPPRIPQLFARTTAPAVKGPEANAGPPQAAPARPTIQTRSRKHVRRWGQPSQFFRCDEPDCPFE